METDIEHSIQGTQDLVAKLLENGALKPMDGLMEDYFTVMIQTQDWNGRNYVFVRKENLIAFLEGRVPEMNVNLEHREIERKSRYNDGEIDVLFHDADGKLAYDTEKQKFCVDSIITRGYWA